MEPGSSTPLVLNTIHLSILIVLLFFNILLSFVFSAYKASRDLDIFISMDEKKARKTLAFRLLEIPELIEVLRISSRISSLSLSILTAVFVVQTYGWNLSAWIWLLIAILFALVIQLMEAVAAGLVSRHPAGWAIRMAGFCRMIYHIHHPLYMLYKIFSPARKNYSQQINEVETHLRDWVENVPENAVLKKEERKMMRSILHFSDTLIREIMIPRVDMTAIDVDSSLDEAARIVLDSGHSRLPVYDDEIDNIIGVLYAKDLLKIYLEQGEDKSPDLRSFLRPPLFVPEAKKAGELLNEMQISGTHMVVVVDEYGGTAGIVSMEDIVEEIVGEIRDEYDESEEQLCNELGPDQYSFLGRIDLDDVNEYLGTHLTKETADTLAGYLYSQIGKVPSGDESFQVEGWLFRIEELSGNRIRRVFVERAAEDDLEEEEDYGTD